MSDLRHWLNSLPIFTRYWLISTVCLSLIGRFGIVNPHYLYLVYDRVINNFEIWRTITSVFYYPLSPATGFHFLINCYFLYNYSLRLEQGLYDRHPADYLYMLLFNWVCCLFIGMMCDFHYLMDPMVLSVLYIWCHCNKNVIVNFWFGSQFQAMYLPWVLFGFNFIMSGGGIMELSGILVGHLYVFLKFQYPQELGGPNWLSTPKFLEDYFPPRTTGSGWFAAPPTAQARPNPARNVFGGHNWGRGQVLGDN